MMTRLLRHPGWIKLVADDLPPSAGKPAALAAMTQFEGTGCWILTDWRLSAYKPLSPYGADLIADDCHASYRPQCAEERAFVQSLLREWETGENGEIIWCTFDNFYRGHPTVKGDRPSWRPDHQSGYFGYAEAYDRLRAIRSFWSNFTGDPTAVRLANPDRQLSETEVFLRVCQARLEEALPPRV